jgi:hypothetical protein
MLGGQYTNLSDAYISVIKSLQHACLAAKYKLEILWIEAAMLEDKSANEAPEKVRLLGVPFFSTGLRGLGARHHLFYGCAQCLVPGPTTLLVQRAPARSVSQRGMYDASCCTASFTLWTGLVTSAMGLHTRVFK